MKTKSLLFASCVVLACIAATAAVHAPRIAAALPHTCLRCGTPTLMQREKHLLLNDAHWYRCLWCGERMAQRDVDMGLTVGDQAASIPWITLSLESVGLAGDADEN